jgi:hypothetical protein
MVMKFSNIESSSIGINLMKQFLVHPSVGKLRILEKDCIFVQQHESRWGNEMPLKTREVIGTIVS